MKKEQIEIDITQLQLEPIDELDEYESDLHNELKKGNFILRNNKELLNWQLEKMCLGLHQAKSNHIASEHDIVRVFNKCKTAK